ncbi:MAG: hypothetical protein JNM69_19330 [Archangium sp.]|nr:hypothetical protein [Archangium sp.]
MRVFISAVVLSFVLACQKGPDAEGPVATRAPAVEVAATPQPETPKAPAADAPPKLTSNPDGTLRLEFVDRWGAKFDATYESFTFLERALPTVSRGLDDARAAQLKQAVEAQRPH